MDVVLYTQHSIRFILVFHGHLWKIWALLYWMWTYSVYFKCTKLQHHHYKCV